MTQSTTISALMNLKMKKTPFQVTFSKFCRFLPLPTQITPPLPILPETHPLEHFSGIHGALWALFSPARPFLLHQSPIAFTRVIRLDWSMLDFLNLRDRLQPRLNRLCLKTRFRMSKFRRVLGLKSLKMRRKRKKFKKVNFCNGFDREF